jgi:mono/diheme cytochrome c family protein
MTLNLNKTLALLVVAALSAMLSGCGDSETNAPAVKLTASTVVSSTDSSAHQHSVSIPFTDVTASPAAGGYQYRSDTVSGHSHVIALSQQQMIDLSNGMQLTLTSSTPSSGASHTHTWTIQGGSVLYEKNCYNCHSNDKRGQNPMNVSFNASQTSAVRSPGSAPVSTAAAATPDPNYAPAAASAAPDGVALYASQCAGCHGALAASTKSNRTAAQIRTAITTVGQMNSLGALTDAQLQAIATALVK